MKLHSSLLVACLLSCGWLVGGESVSVRAQSEVPTFRQDATPTGTEPDPTSPPATKDSATIPQERSVKALPGGQYVMEFNRSPIVGNRLQLRSIYDESRLRFTRPRNLDPRKVQMMLRFRHSAALYATRSNLTVLVNGTSVGSVPLNKKQGEIGNAVFDIPPKLLQDYNEVVIAALQNNSPTCTQDPYDPSLWTEILPDSKLVFDFQPQPIALNFNRYPFPIFDNLSLEPNQIAYLLPKEMDESWLTATSRFQTGLGRFAQFRPMDTRLVKSVNEVKAIDRLVVIGTPKAQPGLSSLNLPLSLKDNQLRDEKQQVLPADVGVLMLTTTSDERTPVLVATGNGPQGVAKAVQFLLQSRDRQIGTGQVVIVRQVTDVPSPAPRDWSGYLPGGNSFQLKDLSTFDNKPFADVTVRGADAPAIEFDFRALPDDKFLSGNVFNLHYSYGPQLNPQTSLLEVQLDGFPIAGKKLDSVDGSKQQILKVELPEDRIKPNSKIQVRFQLDPRERRSCNRSVDQQLWGTVHASTAFQLNRENSAQVPDLKLLQFGYPFAAPQDLSRTAIVVPSTPTEADLLLLLEFSERLGRVSRSESVKLNVYRANNLTPQERDQRHLVAIGKRDNFPLPEALESEGFTLKTLFERQRDKSQVRTLPDAEGIVKEIVSPWNRDRVLLILSGQTEAGLAQVRDLFHQDPLFFQLREDTVLISAIVPDPNPYDPNAYNLEFLQRAKQNRQLSEMGWKDRLIFTLSDSWFVLFPGTVIPGINAIWRISILLETLYPPSEEGVRGKRIMIPI
ncbi:cellulose biosynthesis cyclic di-GMP-binding regulatory protein BcsB [Kovacikia minuta CCNUW1]|uniref:cellulose biosynthesis cyclic di-GMP-binding regulatory protein BcsB n=1 Tax=Kovacikia minuta TaxID=2931930 RepID=UPI001CCCD3F5|nr:cellulose biosynthesis cyclic di-GMP-binding regulatory protein BcsB [Kovacikia minuta]UBF24697.1 cellulose biosynthesis cyclic di-GMP-binding regulatory protein BcsB [Kovacikia minuta CCNUW1]